MKKIFVSILYLWLTIMLVVPVKAFDLDENKLSYMAEDYPPYNFEKEGEVRGISPDLLRLMWKKMNYKEQPIEVLPWARGYKLVQSKKNHVLMSMTRTKEREPLFKWVGPIAVSEYFVIKLSTSKIKINSLDEARKFRIGTVREDATEQILKSLHFDEDKMVVVNKIEQAIKMLRANRIDLITYEKDSFFRLLKIKNYKPDDFEPALLLSKEKDHYAFHIDTPDSLIKKFQDALDSLDKEHKELIDIYFNIL